MYMHRIYSCLMITRHLLLFPLLLCMMLLSSCGGDESASSSGEPAEKDILTVLIINSPTAYYYDRDDQLAGPEYEMTQSFAAYLGVEVEYKAYDSTFQVIDALRNGEGDIAAAGLTINDSRKQHFDFGPAYQTLEEKLVCRRDGKSISSIEDMQGVEIVVSADSSYTDTLKQIPGIDWQADTERNTQSLLEAVAERELDCTVSDTTLFNIERRYHTELAGKYTLADDVKLGWMLEKGNDGLRQSIEEWFAEYSKADLEQMLDRYYGYVEIFDYVDTHKFLQRVDTRLKQYKAMFIDAAQKNDIDPVLLAAQSYQESHWNRKAKSPTGVRGMMMLTQPVAKSLGVKSRLDAKENIYAGAKFLAKMKKMVEHVPEPDRSWLGLAAYNVGRGHFRDAQSLARKLGKDPDKWSDMKTVLPLLSEKKYYKDLRYGYARGNEPVTYVTRIRNYQHLLQKHFNGL